jgi:hypothetical protein
MFSFAMEKARAETRNKSRTLLVMLGDEENTRLEARRTRATRVQELRSIVAV